MISRRPNTRASSEKAPGPRKMIPMSVVTANTTARRESKMTGVDAAQFDRATTTPPKPARAPAIGVRKPTSKKAPAKRAVNPTSQVSAPPPTLQHDRASSRSVTLKTARNSNRAIPDKPPGNAGNKRVRGGLLYLFMGNTTVPHLP
jgi:hypothetical protein